MKKPEQLFKEHFDKFRDVSLFKASLDHYIDTGTISGSLLLEVRAFVENWDRQKNKNGDNIICGLHQPTYDNNGDCYCTTCGAKIEKP